MLMKWTEKIDLALKTESASRKKVNIEESKESKVPIKRKVVAEEEPVK